MDPISLIETALVTGAATSAKDTASQAIKDAYSGLKMLLSRLFADKPKAQVILGTARQTERVVRRKPSAWVRN